MNQITIKRAVGLAAALCMMFVFILGSLPVRAEESSATASVTLTPSEIAAGDDFVMQIDINAPAFKQRTATITIQGVGGLSGSAEFKDVSFSKEGETQITTDAASIKYKGSGETSLFIQMVSKDGTVKEEFVKKVKGFTPTETDNGDDDSGPVTPSTPTGNLIGVKPGTALPSIKAGESKTIEIPLTGTSSNSRYAGKTQITAQLPEGIYFNTATAMQELNFSSRSKEQTLKLPISADSEAKSGVFPITLEAIYKYSGQQIKETIQINLKVEGKTETEASSGLSIKGYQVSKPQIKAGEGFNLTLTVANTGNTPCENVKVTLDGLATEGITVNGGMDTQTIQNIAAGGTGTVTFSLLSSKEMVTGNHSLTANAACGEITGSAKIFVAVEGKPAESDKEEDGPKASTPRVVIDGYTFTTLDEEGNPAEENSQSVEGGKTFRLSLNLKNTSTAAAVENLKMTISSVADDTTGGVFTPANSSNTFFISKVGAGQSFSEVIDLLVKADAPPKSYGLQVSVSYEAVLNNERVTVDDSETITIPVTQPDRFEVEDVQVWGPVYFGESINPTVNYVNKGKSSIYNLSIRVEGTNFTTGEPSSYVGNVESGNGDYYEASLNPEAVGMVEGKFILSYEDAAGNLKEVEKPFSVEVIEMENPDPGIDVGPVEPIEPESTGMPVWGWILIGVGVAGAAVVTILIIKKKKASKKLDAEDDYDD